MKNPFMPGTPLADAWASGYETGIKARKSRAVVSSDFEEFWRAYPKKASKGAAMKAWASQNPPIQQCLDTLAWQRNSDQWRKENGAWIPNPATWINAAKWLDERPSSSRSAGLPNSDFEREFKAAMKGAQ